MPSTPTADDVARWMHQQLEQANWLYQDQTAYSIQASFGPQFTYHNANGNLAIGKDVLKAFRKQSGDNVVWERGQRCWRKRTDYDKPGRQQD